MIRNYKVLILGGLLSACSVGHESFDCPNGGTGYGCKTLKEVHELVNMNHMEKITPPVGTPVIGTVKGCKLDGKKVSYGDNSIVDRTKEEQVRVWIAPFQDEQGNFHEPSVIHTVNRPSYWQMNTVNWD
jgi:conjugal transfer pilus assembly protein TraV